MFLSIIIPTRNRFEFLQKLFESLFIQIEKETKEVEVIVVDDGSYKTVWEKNKNICSLFGAYYLYLNKRFGAAFARNYGIKWSMGEWIAFLDDDVILDANWYDSLSKEISCLKEGVVGIEGKVEASGSGLWDMEVKNTKGKMYLSCNIIYKRDILIKTGGFDDFFNSNYPMCEDQELAARILRYGKIIFSDSICVIHQPRKVNLVRYILHSLKRMFYLLYSEYYFYEKQKDRYHLFRFNTNFWQTYKAIILRHVITNFRRRNIKQIISNPLQSFTLLISSLLEQLSALFLLPFFIFKYIKIPFNFFDDYIDYKKTLKFWQINNYKFKTKNKAKINIIKKILLINAPTEYSIYNFYKFYNSACKISHINIFLRIDDVFLDKGDIVVELCKIFNTRKIPFLASIIGQQLLEKKYYNLLEEIINSGGEIGFHGFYHKGKYGPYNSELLQMSYKEIEKEILLVLNCLPEKYKPFVFIPPFNTISRDQIFFMSNYFDVICGGPETIRFTDRIIGPVSLLNGSWYISSFQPFYINYNKSKKILFKKNKLKYNNIIYSFHFIEEAKNNFVNLIRLLDNKENNFCSWKIFKKIK